MSCIRANSHRRRAVVVVFVMVSIVTLLLFAALAVDVGHICALTAEQQNNADASALAGASGLQDETHVEALVRAVDFLQRNQIPQNFESLDDQVIEFGWWDFSTNRFKLLDDSKEAFAVHVRAARNNTKLFFAGLAGISETDVSRAAVSIASKPCQGIWGLEGIKAGSINTDSFDSTVNPYDAADAQNNGGLCSGRGIVAGGSFDVRGSVMTGFGYPLRVNGSSGQITGVTTAKIEDVVPPPIDFGDVDYVNDNDTIGLTDSGRSPWAGGGWDLKLSGDDITIPGGKYYFESISLSGGATITFTGPVTFYVNGDISAAGGSLINKTEDPSNLSIISRGSNIRLTGGADFHGSILAPLAEVKMTGNATYYGALVGKFVTLSGDFTAHVDESLPLSKAWHTPPPPTLVK